MKKPLALTVSTKEIADSKQGLPKKKAKKKADMLMFDTNFDPKGESLVALKNLTKSVSNFTAPESLLGVTSTNLSVYTISKIKRI